MNRHDLHAEFPEFDEKIHELKVSNNHFRKLFERYENLNHKIHGLETTGIFDDTELKELRTQRVGLKDELYNILKNA
jgi:uncharacterized protein YdcH (DUF465 family)